MEHLFLNHGSFIISLDFELMWGVRDISTIEGYGKSNVKNVKQVISRLLELFEKYNVKATIATVGLIMLSNKEDALFMQPSLLPSYYNKLLSPYENNYIKNISSRYNELFFLPHTVDAIKESENIEIGSHTFCHYYCLAEGQTVEQFEEDLKTAIKIADLNDINIRSIIFPRNQVSKPYLSICSKYNVECYRGNALRFFGAKTKSQRIKNKIGRFLDSYINIGPRTSYSYSSININEKPVNIRASRFLRPYKGGFAIIEPWRIRRIKKEIKYAAKHNEVYHLWWHPHNFGKNMERNFYNLETILRCFAVCRDKYGMQSFSISGLLDALKNT